MRIKAFLLFIFISAVHAGRCEIASHLLVTRFPAADYSVLFSACPMTIAASNYDVLDYKDNDNYDIDIFA